MASNHAFGLNGLSDGDWEDLFKAAFSAESGLTTITWSVERVWQRSVPLYQKPGKGAALFPESADDLKSLISKLGDSSKGSSLYLEIVPSHTGDFHRLYLKSAGSAGVWNVAYNGPREPNKPYEEGDNYSSLPEVIEESLEQYIKPEKSLLPGGFTGYYPVPENLQMGASYVAKGVSDLHVQAWARSTEFGSRREITFEDFAIVQRRLFSVGYDFDYLKRDLSPDDWDSYSFEFQSMFTSEGVDFEDPATVRLYEAVDRGNKAMTLYMAAVIPKGARKVRLYPLFHFSSRGGPWQMPGTVMSDTLNRK